MNGAMGVSLNTVGRDGVDPLLAPRNDRSVICVAHDDLQVEIAPGIRRTLGDRTVHLDPHDAAGRPPPTSTARS